MNDFRNRDERPGNRPSNRNQQGRKEQQKPLALTFSMINYLTTSKQLVAMVQATRGNKPAEAVDIQLLVPPTTLGMGKTDRNGRATFTVDINYPPKTYPLIAETVGVESAQATSAFVVPQPYEMTEDSPLVFLAVESVEVSDTFVLIANVTGRRGMTPLQNATVRIDYDTDGVSQMELVSLNGAGAASKRLTIPINSRKKIVVSIRATLSGMPGSPSDTKVITLERTIKRPAQMTYQTRPVNGGSEYEIILCVEDADAKPIRGVELDAATDVGFLTKTTATTDENGKARLTITLSPDHEYTECTVDCPGLLDIATIRIRQPQAPGWCSGRGPIIGAGISLLFAMILFALVPFGIIRNVGSFLDHPTVENVVIPPVDSLRNATEKDAYKYLAYKKPNYDMDTIVDSSQATAQSRVGWSFTTYLWLLFWCGVCLAIASIFALISLFCRADQLYEWVEGYIRERRYGVADNEPNLWGRMLNRYLGHNDGKGEAVTATGAKPATGQSEMSAKDKGSSLNHWMPVILYGIGDFFFERVIHLFTKSKSEKNEKK
jgi:hypothetical protein